MATPPVTRRMVRSRCILSTGEGSPSQPAQRPECEATGAEDGDRKGRPHWPVPAFVKAELHQVAGEHVLAASEQVGNYELGERGDEYQQRPGQPPRAVHGQEYSADGIKFASAQGC